MFLQLINNFSYLRICQIMLMNTIEKLSADLNSLNAAFKETEEYFLIQKIQMQSTTVSSVDKNRIKESILKAYSPLFLSISLDKNINVIITCVLSSMQFTSTTISQILNLEDSSVRSLKHRLKKKMEPEMFNLFFETKDEPHKQVAVTPKKKLTPYIVGMLGCVAAVVLFFAFRSSDKQTELSYTAKNDAILDETRFIRVSENQENVEYSLKKGNSNPNNLPCLKARRIIILNT